MAQITVDVTLRVVSGRIEKRIGGVVVTGNFPPLAAKDKLNFHCATPFAFFLTRLQRVTATPKRRRISAATSRFVSPFVPPSLVYCSDNGTIPLKVKDVPIPGFYTFVLAVDDGSGNIVTLDPQIIIQ